MKGVEDYFKGLADIDRLRIINLLLQGEAVAVTFGMCWQFTIECLPAPNVSRAVRAGRGSARRLPRLSTAWSKVTERNTRD